MKTCEKCRRISSTKEKLNRIIVQTREKVYVNKFLDKQGNEKEKITTGYETVKELNICNDCYENLKGKTL